MSPWERRRILIVAKTYPQPSVKYRETVCTAGIDEDGNWLRLYPIPYRDLPPEQQFGKFDIVEMLIKTATDDRPESHTVDRESIRVLDSISSQHWESRLDWLLPALAPSVESLNRDQEATGRSLGLIKPSVTRFSVEAAPVPNWTSEERGKLTGAGQMELFPELYGTDRRLLDKVPYRFLYEFTDDEPQCSGHRMRVLDWEAYAFYLLRLSSTDLDAVRSGMTTRFYDWMALARDLHFVMGTLRAYPRTWTIISLFYPPRTGQFRLAF